MLRQLSGGGALCESFRERNQRARRERGAGRDGGRGWREKIFSKPSRLLMKQFFNNFGFLDDSILIPQKFLYSQTPDRPPCGAAMLTTCTSRKTGGTRTLWDVGAPSWLPSSDEILAIAWRLPCLGIHYDVRKRSTR